MAPTRRTSRSVRKTTTAPRDKAWAAMRVFHSSQGYFTIPDVITAAGISKASLLRYMAALERAGYLVKIKNGDRRGGIPNRYSLLRNSGPFRPWAQSDGVVYDRNTGIEHPPTKETRYARSN